MKKILFGYTLLLLLFVSGVFAQTGEKIKYVFLFIGDGMGINQVYLADKYNAITNDKPLFFMNNAWSFGLVTTECADSNRTTDSGAGGTAIACGQRTSFESIGEYNGKELQSIAEYLHKTKKFKIGILTSVPINHATPAVFYGHEPHRTNYSNLIDDLINSGFEFFAGGGFLSGNKNDTSKISNLAFEQIITKLQKNNYEVLMNEMQMVKLKSGEFQKVVCVDTAIRNSRKQFEKTDKDEFNSLPFVLDEPQLKKQLSFYTSLALEFLMNDKGFFIMVEGGKIDWACHKNDALTAIYEINAMNDAIAVAYDFYLKHPENTLIIVTADHETGGMSLGSGNDNNLSINNYAFYPGKLQQQKQSYLFINRTQLQQIQNEAQIGWTTSEHTSAPVGIWAIGKGKEKFSGMMKNSDIKDKILELVR